MRITRPQPDGSTRARPEEDDLGAELGVLLGRIGKPEHQIWRLVARALRASEGGDRVQSRCGTTGASVAEVDVHGGVVDEVRAHSWHVGDRALGADARTKQD